MISIDVLIETKDLADRGYVQLCTFGNGDIYAREQEPEARFLGHFIDSEKRYIRLTDKYSK